MMHHYKAYSVETAEDPPGQWKAYVRRLDGQPISTEPYGPKLLVMSTMAFFSEAAAIAEAKRAIDGGGMK